MKVLRSEIIVSIVVFIVALIFLIQSLRLPYISEIGPGPGFFPLWLSGILLIVSCVYIFQSIRKTNKNQDFKWLPDSQVLKRILYILGCMVLFVLLIFFLGFVLTSTTFLFLLLFREYRWIKSFVISITVSLILFWVFGTMLNVALPVNVFGW